MHLFKTEKLETKKLSQFPCSFIFTSDGSAGNGSDIGKCPSSYGSYKCLSTGACNVCGLISGIAEGCDITSTSPVCDADSLTSGIQDSAIGKVAQCVACKKSGENYPIVSLQSNLVESKSL